MFIIISACTNNYSVRSDSNHFSRSQKNVEVEEPPVEGHFTPHPSDVLDMPVDPNEPTYCLCHQVSYGEMIGCDNNDCPIGECQVAESRELIKYFLSFSYQSPFDFIAHRGKSLPRW